MKSSDPTVLPLGPTPNSESQTLPPFVSVVSKGVRMRPNNSSRSAWRYFTQINEHKKGKNHTRLTHRLIHSSPTAAKITTSQRNHVLLLLDWLCPMTATDRFSFSPGRADSEPQLKQISIDLKAVGFTIIPFFFLCVWSLSLVSLHRGVCSLNLLAYLKLSSLNTLPFCHLRPKSGVLESLKARCN